MRRAARSHLRLSHIKFFLIYKGQFPALDLNSSGVQLLGIRQVVSELAWFTSA